MLSYQHSYHAGNLADVQKHALLATALAYMTAKPKPMSYIETHAGRGLYDLGSEAAQKTGEAAAGILRLEGAFPADHPYRQRLAETRARFGPMAYPGSPLVAALSLRDGDVIHLCDLHPQEFDALSTVMQPWGAHLHREDGLKAALALTPPMPRRGLMLIDPSWEVKSDYATVPRIIGQVARKWNVGVIALWYPILGPAPHAPMLEALETAHPDSLRHEIRFPPARDGHGMTGSGLFVINPPFGLADEAARLTRILSAG